MSVAAPGSVVLRHWQFGFGCAGWCIGQLAFAPCTQVQVIGSAPCDVFESSDNGAAVSTDS